MKKKIVTPDFITKKVVDIIDWSKVPNGTKFTAKRNSGSFSGRVFKEKGNWYFLQNRYDGSKPSTTLGFKYGYSVGTNPSIGTGITSIVLTADPDFKFKLPVKVPSMRIARNDVILDPMSKTIEIGCTSVDMETLTTLYKAAEKAFTEVVPVAKKVIVKKTAAKKVAVKKVVAKRPVGRPRKAR